MVTNGTGRRDKIVFRYVHLDPDRKTIPVTEPLILTATDDVTKASGACRVTLANSADPARVVMLDKLFGGLRKAKNAEVYAFTWQRFEEFPDLWLSGVDFAAARKVSDANPQQADYSWGRAERIDYINGDGATLPAVLIKPDGFDPAKKYPLMVYIYETMAEGLHRYYPPSPGTNINFTRYVSNGYVILCPDITYEVGYPGPSALKCVIPAVEKVLGMGFIDPKRVGIQGHSWGGYQISYMITQTDVFAAVEAGASVVNMTSAYGGIRWGTGMSRAFQYEKTQSRIGAPLWSAGPPASSRTRPSSGSSGSRLPISRSTTTRTTPCPGTRGSSFLGPPPTRQGSLHVQLQRREARAPGAREPEVLDRPPGRVLRPLPSREAAAGVDGQGGPLSRTRQAGRQRAVQETGGEKEP